MTDLTDSLRPDWDGKKLLEAARDKAREILGPKHPISGLLAHAAHDYGNERWFNWRWPIAQNVGLMAEMLMAGKLLPSDVKRAEPDDVTRYQHLLGAIWLYIDWRYVTRQLTTEQKELWADAVDAFGEPEPGKAERWWRDDYVEKTA